MKPIRIDAQAEDEIYFAARRYRQKRRGLDVRFLNALDDVYKGIVSHPHGGLRVPGVSNPAVWRAAVRKFPYFIIYAELDDHWRVLAVAHSKRRPNYWIARLDP